jgi:hypothetical protein
LQQAEPIDSTIASAVAGVVRADERDKSCETDQE